MKFKYMLRGMGLGVIITAVLMGAYNRNAVADARVAVLREYGIGQEAVLVEATETDEEVSESEAVVQTTEPIIVRNEEIESEIRSELDAAEASEQAAENMTAAMEQSDSATEVSQEPDFTAEASQQTDSTVQSEQEPDETVPSGEMVQIVIAKGDDSGTVSRKLYNAGLIENAAEYDAFLMQHGYDKKISTGTKTIFVTDSWQEMAEKLTGN